MTTPSDHPPIISPAAAARAPHADMDLSERGCEGPVAQRAGGCSEGSWQPIETAPTDGTSVWVFVAEREGLPSFQCACAYHESGGWCCDEIREVTHWMPLPEPPK